MEESAPLKRKKNQIRRQGSKKVKLSRCSEATTNLASPIPTENTSLSKKRERRKQFKKEIRRKLLKEGKLSRQKKRKMSSKSWVDKSAAQSSAAGTETPKRFDGELSENWKALQSVLKQENVKTGRQKSNRGRNRNRSNPGDLRPQSKEGQLKRETGQSTSAGHSLETKPEIWFEIDDDMPWENVAPAEPSVFPVEELQTTQPTEGVTHIVGLDCEMVGVGENGHDSILARVSIVNQHGRPFYDKYVKPTEEVTDYRTAVSGIRPHNLGKDAVPFQQAQAEVAAILKDKILVGHALSNDLSVLFLSHPFRRTRDTQKYKPFRKLFGGLPSLKRLASHFLDLSIQTGEHSSVEDAQVAMRLYMSRRSEWEAEIRQKRKGKEKKSD